MKCDGCSKSFDLPDLHAVTVPDAELPLFLCCLCEAEERRNLAECTCEFSGDMADASSCELHGQFASTLVSAGVTREEGEAFLTWIDRKPAKVERMQGELFPGEVA
jgi:hypothetical protein